MTRPTQTQGSPDVALEDVAILTETHTYPAFDRDVTAFLATCSPADGAAPEHDPAWLAVLRQGLKQEPVPLVAREGGPDGPVVGYLPLAFVSSLLFGKFLVSLPYLNRAGVVARDTAIADALLDRAVELAEQRDVAYLEVRNHEQDREHPKLPDQMSAKARMVMDLPDSEQCMWDGIKSKVRSQVRKAGKTEHDVSFGGEENLDTFYDIFAQNMRDLGTPVYGKGFFRSIREHLGERAEFVVVRCAGTPAAAALLVHDPGNGHRPPSTQVPSASCLSAFNRSNTNMWMYFRLFVRAIERGSKRFDFGRSSEGSGTYRFKKQWGATPEPTVWQYHLVKGNAQAMRPDSEANAWKVNLWKKLPVAVTRWVGPAIVRGIP